MKLTHQRPPEASYPAERYIMDARTKYTKSAYASLKAEMAYEKFAAICAEIPTTDPAHVVEMIDTDWNEPDHAEWIASASPKVIADWVAANK